MRVRATDPQTGGIVTSGQQFVFDEYAVAQTIKTRLRLFLGEYFRNIDIGTPWAQTIQVKTATISTKNAIIREIIVQTDEVEQILTYNADFDIQTRSLTISADVLTTFGRVKLNLEQGLTSLKTGAT